MKKMRRPPNLISYYRPTQEQFRLMLDFMESHGDISQHEPGKEGQRRSDRLWRKLVTILHGVDEGTEKEVKEWRKVWADWKIKTKRKIAAYNQGKLNDSGKEGEENPLGERMLRIMSTTGFPKVELQEDDIPASTTSRSTSSSPMSMSYGLGIEFQEAIATSLMLNHEPRRIDLAEASTSQAPDNPSVQRDARSPSPVITPSRQQALERRRRRRQTRLERPKSIDVKRGWLRLEKQRLRKEHEREMVRLRLEQQRLEREHDRDVERLRVEALRVDMENKRTAMFEKITNIGNEMLGLLSVISKRVRN